MKKFVLFLMSVLMLWSVLSARSKYWEFDPSPFGVGIHMWTTRGPGSYPGTWDESRTPYDDGIDDGMTNSKLFDLIVSMGAKWVRDYGYSEGGYFYWPEKRGYDYVDSFIKTVEHYKLSLIHTNIGFGCHDIWEEYGGAPDDWPKFFKMQKEEAQRYKGRIKYYKIGHEIDNLDGRRWKASCKQYVKYLKYSHDAIKSVDPDIVICLGDLALPDGNSLEWNNGEYFYKDGSMELVEENAFEKILYEITTNGNSPEYDTRQFGGFPPSTNILDYFEVVGFNCYPQSQGNFVQYDMKIDYLTSCLKKYKLENEIPLEINETGLLLSGQGTPELREEQARFCRDAYRYVLRTGKVKRIYYFHFDPMNYEDEALFASMIDFDVDNDKKNDPEITKFPVWYAYRKMTHFEEDFTEEDFTKLDLKGPWYLQGWMTKGLTGAEVKDGILTFKTAGKESYIYFADLCLPAEIYSNLEVKIRSDKDGTCIFYWDNTTTNEKVKFNNKKSVQFPLKGDNIFDIYKINLSENKEWKGIVGGIKLQVCPKETAKIEIDSIRILKK